MLYFPQVPLETYSEFCFTRYSECIDISHISCHEGYNAKLIEYLNFVSDL